MVRPGVAQRLLRLRGSLPGATHQHDVLVEMLDDLVAVLAQQIERNVVGPGDVRGLKLARGSDVENPRWRGRTEQLAEVLGIDGGGGGHVDGVLSGWPAVPSRLDRYHRGYVELHDYTYPPG